MGALSAQQQPTTIDTAASGSAKTTANASTGTATSKPTAQLVTLDEPDRSFFLGLTIIAVLVAGIVLYFRATRRDPAKEKEGFFRNEIAKLVLNSCIWGLFGLATLTILAAWFGPKSTDGTTSMTATTAKDIFNSVLPVLGTWVGTLLTFYFARENFTAANPKKSEAPDETTVQSIMLPPPFLALDKELTALGDDMKLKGVLDYMEKQRSSLPAGSNICPTRIFIPKAATGQDSQMVRFILTKELIDIYMKIAGNDTGTLKDISNDVRFKQALFDFSYGTVQPDAALVRAKSVLENLSTKITLSDSSTIAYRCHDILITQTGRNDSPVLGWVTEEMLAKATA